MHREPGLATEKEIGETWIAADRPSTRLDHFDICKSVGRLLKPAKLTMAAGFAACPKNPEYSHAIRTVTTRVRPPSWQVLHPIRLPEIIKLNSHGSRTELRCCS